MTDRGWAACALLLNECWQGGMSEAKALAYRTVLDIYSDEEVDCAMRRVLRQGGQFLPSAAVLVLECTKVRQDGALRSEARWARITGQPLPRKLLLP